jgi:hypothetical protein
LEASDYSLLPGGGFHKLEAYATADQEICIPGGHFVVSEAAIVVVVVYVIVNRKVNGLL